MNSKKIIQLFAVLPAILLVMFLISGSFGFYLIQNSSTDTFFVSALTATLFFGFLSGSLISFKVFKNLKELVSENLLSLEKLDASRDQLVELEKLASIGELTAGVAHEINNPLAIIAGNITRIQDTLESNQQTSEDLNKRFEAQKNSVDRISNLVSSLNYLAKSEDDEIQIVEVHLLLSEMQKMLSDIYKNENVELLFDLRANGSLVKASPGKIHQIILNLINNAKDSVEFRPKKQIKIITKDFDGKLGIQVKDTGSGIEQKNFKKIFDSFFTTKAVGNGTGIGLSLVKKFVEEMDGIIDVESQLDVGTTFNILLPKSSSTAQLVHEKEFSYTALNGKVLVVEDEPELRSLVADTLTSMGLDVVDVADGRLALDKLESEDFNFLITDVQMPNFSGDRLIFHLKKIMNEIPIIVITGGVNPSAQNKKALMLADCVLEKPVAKRDLYDAAVQCLTKSKALEIKKIA